VHFHAVEPGGLRALGGMDEARDDVWNLIITQLARDFVRLFPLGRVSLVVLDPQRTGGDRLPPVVQQRMACASAMPDLQHDPAAFGVHGVGDRLPPGNLGRGVNARFPAAERRVAFHCHGRLGHHQTGARPLRVIFRHDGCRNMLRISARAGEGGHDDAVGKAQVAECDRGEEGGNGRHSSRHYRMQARRVFKPVGQIVPRGIFLVRISINAEAL
jgi:hypothetical protein